MNAGFTIDAALARWWYNNSFTQAVIRADEEQKKRAQQDAQLRIIKKNGAPSVRMISDEGALLTHILTHIFEERKEKEG